MSSISVRCADISDAAELCRLIHKLAEYEKMSEQCTLTPHKLAELMGEPNGLGGIIAEQDGRAVGMLVYSVYKLATFSGKRVFYIEDIFVEEPLRGCGTGSALFKKAEKLAKELDCIRLEWKCLSWNENAKSFYEKRGGISDPQWLTYTSEI